MFRQSLRCLPLLAGLVLPSAVAAAQEVTADPTSLLWGRQFTEWFYAGEADSLFARMSADNQKDIGSPQDILGILNQVHERGGMEDEVISEEVKPDTSTAGGYRYVRRTRFSNVPEMVIRVVWVVDRERKIAGFGIRPEQ